MPDREYVYQFKLDAAQAKREAGQIARIFNAALRDIELKPKISIGNLNQVQQSIQKQINQAQAQAKPAAGSATAAALNPYKAQLESAKLLREEIKDREREEKANLAILGHQTSELKMQEALLNKREISLRRQARDARAAQLGMNPGALQSIRTSSTLSGGSGQFGGELIPGYNRIANFAGYTVAGMAITELGRRALDTTIALTEQGTSLRRADFAARQLAGSTDRLNSLMEVYQRITGATQTTGEAKSSLSTLIALGNADSDAELTRFLTASLGSSRGTGRGMDYIMQELQLTIANKSERRLDQLGLSIEEVRKQEAALKGVNEEARFGEAVITSLINKYGGLVNSAEAGASGLELLTKNLRELREEMARNVEKGLNPTFESWAVGMGSQNTGAQVRQLRRMADPKLNEAFNYLPPKLEAEQTWAFHRAASLFEEVDDAARKGGKGMEELRGRVQSLVTEIVTSEHATSEQITQLGILETQYRLTANGGIVYADAMNEAERAALRLAAAQDVANASFAQAQALLKTLYNGQLYVNLPTVGLQPALGPNLPSDDYMRQRSIMQGGGFLTPGGANMGDVRGGWQEKWRQQNEQSTKDAIREREQAEKDAIRESEQAWKSAANATERAFKDAAQELESSIKSIPGLFGRSDVTKEQGEMAKMGVAQNFADNYLRRLTDEVLNGVDWEGVSLTDAANRAGIDQKLDPKAQLAIFSQKWADQSLFANASNLDLFDQDAIRAELERQRQSKMGQENIMGMFGLGKDNEGGTVFKDLGGIMANGMKAGAEEGLAQFGRDAIATTMMQLKNDTAIQEYMAVGETMFGATFDGYVAGATKSDLVGAIVAEAMRQINDLLDGNP